MEHEEHDCHDVENRRPSTRRTMATLRVRSLTRIVNPDPRSWPLRRMRVPARC
jgi:hypothetical protein